MSAHMDPCPEDQYRQMIDEVLIDELPAPKWEKLRKHLAVCPVCCARYNKAVLAERMLHGGPEAVSSPSPAELDRIGQAVFAATNEAGELAEKPALQKLLSWLAPPQRWATGLVAAAAALALIPILSHMNQSKPTEFQPRGNDKGPVELFSTHPKSTERLAGLRAFCLKNEKIEPLDVKGPTPPKCDRADQLKLAVSNPGKYQRVFLVGLDAEHALKWYAPKPNPDGTLTGRESVPVPSPDTKPGVTVEPHGEVPVGPSVRLVVNHQAGPVRIYALFSDQAIPATEIETASRELAKRKVPISQKEAESLPLKRPDVLQRSLLIDVQ
jgi:hypothetical protein